ncbi:MAG: hypothetical protein ACI9SP_000236 [Arenicella sp.]|jgi:hypothetical protein
MKNTIESRISIDVPAAVVWNNLIQLKDYTDWNPFIIRAEGKLALGEKISIDVQPVGKSPMKFTPTIIDYQEGARVAWLGKFLLSGVFDGKHSFEVREQANGGSVFIQKEEFNGLLVPLMKSAINGGIYQGFEKMNQALKARCEGQ